jgi:tetratricopeptide (TPR) repeat protein
LTTEYFRALNTNKNPHEIIDIIKKILIIDPNLGTFWFNLGIQYKLIHEFGKAIEAFERSLDLSAESSDRPIIQVYDYMGHCYHRLGLYKEELQLYDSGLVHYPDHPLLIGRQAICYYSMGKIREAGKLFDKYQAYWLSQDRNEADILHSIGLLYLDTDNRKAERYFRNALKLDPGAIEKQSSLARVLITMGVRMNEAMEVLETAMEAEPDNPTLLHLYGWGYFRMEEYSLAKEYLSMADSLSPEYNHSLKLHLDKAEEILSIKLFRIRQ